MELIESINQLDQLRSAPEINSAQKQILFEQLIPFMDKAQWFTVGIMASSEKEAIDSLREMEKLFRWPQMKIVKEVDSDGPVFLKANQKSGEIHIRIEYGLGEGILISCQHNDQLTPSDTFGPFPLDFFRK